MAHNPRVRDSQGHPYSPSVRTLAVPGSPWLGCSQATSRLPCCLPSPRLERARPNRKPYVSCGGPLRRTAGPGLHRPHSTLPSPCSRPSMSEHCRIAALSQQDSNLTSRGNMHAPSAADFQKASIRPTHQPLVLVIRPGSSPGEEVSRATAVFGAGCHRRQPCPGPVQLEKECSTVEKSVCWGQQAGLSSSSAANACRCTEASSLMRRDSS